MIVRGWPPRPSEEHPSSAATRRRAPLIPNPLFPNLLLVSNNRQTAYYYGVEFHPSPTTALPRRRWLRDRSPGIAKNLPFGHDCSALDRNEWLDWPLSRCATSLRTGRLCTDPRHLRAFSSNEIFRPGLFEYGGQSPSDRGRCCRGSRCVRPVESVACKKS